jgi:hypothetical protein
MTAPGIPWALNIKDYGNCRYRRVADCEGFLEQFMDENPKLYQQLSLIMFKKDYPNKCNYAKIENTLKTNGFTCLVGRFHSVWKKI